MFRTGAKIDVALKEQKPAAGDNNNANDHKISARWADVAALSQTRDELCVYKYLIVI